ncbi:MAG: creatininase family protein [Planctomycetes bacterium]|nr:creatininase family protein [Planctomycetota bacterium]
MTSEAEVLLRKITRREFRERMAAGDLRVCIIPIASIEQHLEHLAMEHDWRSVALVATSVAERLRPRVLVAEGVMAGISEHHMKHAGTLTLRPGTFLAVLDDLIRSVVKAGFENVLVLNGHGGNIAPIEGTWDQFLREFQVNLHFLSYWDVLTEADAEAVLESGQRLPDDLPGHAQEFETSIGLAEFPENVRTEVWTDQPDPTPAMADAEKGREMMDRIIDRVTSFVQDIIHGRRTAEVPPFFL